LFGDNLLSFIICDLFAYYETHVFGKYRAPRQNGKRWTAHLSMSRFRLHSTLWPDGDLDAQLFANAETHKGIMESSADPASYGFSGGWPQSFGE